MTQQRPEPSGDLTALEIADAMWLASVVSRRGGALDRPPGPDPRSSEVPPDPPESGPARPRDQAPPPPDVWPEVRRPDHAASGDGSPPGGLDAESATSEQPRPSGQPTRGAPQPSPALDGQSGQLPALSDPLALARALRPLRTHTAESRNRLFDEAATARRAAEDDFWLPVFRRARSRPWDEATLIIDDSPTMSLWTRTGAEFAELLARIDAFATVRTLRLDTTNGADDRPPVLRNRADEVSPRSLGGPGRRSVVLVLTDGIGAAWRTGMAPALLRDLARTHTTAVVHVLPERAWTLSGITVRSVPLRLAAPGPGNTGLLVSRQSDEDAFDELAFQEEGWGWDAEGPAEPLVPVLGLRPGFLGQWSRLAVGRRTSEPLKLPVMLDVDSDSEGFGAAARAGASSAEDTVRRVRPRLSRTAFDGAVRLAALPLSEAVVRLLPPLLDPGFKLEHLGELLASKLLLMEPAGVEGGFAFDPGIREELLAHGNRADTFQALRMARPIVTDPVQHEVLTYQLRVLRGEDAAPPVVTEANRAHVTLSTAVLRAVSGPLAATGIRVAPEEAVVQQPVPVAAVATAEAVTLSTVGRSHRPSSIWHGVPPRNLHFSGRARELATLEGWLTPDGPMTAVDALLGMGGIGKSQLAIEYVYRHSHAYDVVCWIPSDQPARIRAAFQEIAQLLGLPLSSDAPANEAVPAVLEALRAGDLWQRWLLVFDNAESVGEVQPFFPLSGPGRVLVTSRNSQWAHVARTLEVDVFSRQESRSLLRRRGEHITDDHADRLAEALGDLPLALEQASVWLLDTGMPVPEYLHLFQEKHDELLSVSPIQHYDMPVAAAWNIALDRLREESPLALRILQVCSQLASTSVPRSLFLAAGGEHAGPDALPATDPIRLGRAVRALNRYSLARIDHRADSVQVHRLVGIAVTHRMPPAERHDIRRTAWRLLAAQPPGAHLTDHLIASGAAAATEESVRSAVRAQLEWLASNGATEDERRLSREVYGVGGP
ncbi:FxSxx-COOH system tetratricopeptide repeat protein [Streptomyces antibioticus]|uniref:FxSxx-COOH system tetratricopeptide repeat protein n=1 Tax=Streptomyces antibioticus TaxID=1890 RepID=UPI002258FBEA|nr:FxSxx-COOH system tetratricopeptide repeat protein [Streptomyces antibioticus]MCX5173370.1 FxSxx-COOH system tetratricopeptide repeat protein [Streptomyces antibioticus]